MKSIIILFFIGLFGFFQSKQIDFFGTKIKVNPICEVKNSTVFYQKNLLTWLDAPPEMFRNMILSKVKEKIETEKYTEVGTTDLNIKLLKFKWLGKISKFKKENNDSITNFIQLFATIKGKERLLMMVYKTPKNEAFRIPKYFDFLTK